MTISSVEPIFLWAQLRSLPQVLTIFLLTFHRLNPNLLFYQKFKYVNV
jgi:hypothetical protein